MDISDIKRTRRVLGALLDRIFPQDAVMSILFGGLRGMRWVKGSGNNGYWLGTYEWRKQRLFAKNIKRGDVVFDIGAHAGFYTLLASRIVGETGAVFTFEPLPRNIDFLKRHCELNHCGNVRVIEAAVSDRSGAEYFDTKENSFGGSVTDKATDVQVKTTSLDDFLAAAKCPTPDVIKIDVEGAETRVLLGAASLLQAHHPTLFLATHSPTLRGECHMFLKQHGYRLMPIDGNDIDSCSEVLAFASEKKES